MKHIQSLTGPTTRRLLYLVSILLVFCGVACNRAPKPAPVAHRPIIVMEPIVQAKRALIISIDGLRPDLLTRSQIPTIQMLLENGSFTLWARTATECWTLPSHTNMLTGVTSAKHGITINGAKPGVYPKVPTLFDVAKGAGRTTAMITSKKKFATFERPGAIDWSFVPTQDMADDPFIAQRAVEVIHEHHPDVMFVHLAGVDSAGHKVGWGSGAQIEAVSMADNAVGLILRQLQDDGLLDSTFIIITADHGGAGLSHGPDDPRSRSIPWIAVGPRVRKNFDLTAYPHLDIDTQDTFCTVVSVLGLPMPPDLDGKPIPQIVEETELLKPAATQPKEIRHDMHAAPPRNRSRVGSFISIKRESK